MQVRIEEVSPVEKKMFVEIPWETVSQKLGDAYRELGKGVALKGFRKGKVPRPVLEQVYGQRVNAEVAYELEVFFPARIVVALRHLVDACAAGERGIRVLDPRREEKWSRHLSGWTTQARRRNARTICYTRSVAEMRDAMTSMLGSTASRSTG